jgi:hypothetical protein
MATANYAWMLDYKINPVYLRHSVYTDYAELLRLS